MSDGVGKSKGNSFEFAYKIPSKAAKDRLEGQIVFSVTRTKTTPSVKVGETKVSVEKKKGEKAGATMTAALAKADLMKSGEILPGVILKVDASLFEGKLEGSGKIDLDVVKLNGVIEGNIVAPDDPAKGTGSDVLDLIIADFSDDLERAATVKIAGKISIKIDPSDVVKLKRMMETQRAITKNLVETKKLEETAKNIQKNQKKLNDLLAQTGSKKKPGNAKARKALLDQIEKNKKKLATIEKKIVGNKKAYDTLAKSGKALAKSLKSKEGRLMAEGLKKAGGKVLAKLIPGINLISTAYDIYEIGSAIYTIVKADGKVEFGPGGDDAGSAAGTPGGVPLDLDDMSEEDIKAICDASPDLPVEATTPVEDNTASDDKVKLNATAIALLKALKKKNVKGAKQMTAEDIEDLNEALPENITSEELDALLDAIENGEFKDSQDSFDLVGGLHRRLADLRGGRVTPPSPEEQSTPSTDGGGDKPGTGEPSPKVPPPPEDKSKPVLHPAARQVADALMAKQGLKVSPEDLLRFNDAVPSDLTPDQLKALLERIAAAPKVPAGSMDDVVKAVEKTVKEVREVKAPKPGEPAAEGDAAEAQQGQPAKPGDITDPARLEKLKKALEAGQKAMDSAGFQSVWLPVGGVKFKVSMKEGDSFDVFFAMRSNQGPVGNWLKIVVVSVNATSKTAEIRMYPASLYNTSGKVAGKTNSSNVTTHMR